MTRRRIQLSAAAALAGALLLVLFGFTSRRADNAVLTGTDGANDAFTISLVDANGAPVKHLDPGTYTIVVHDLSGIHNFHLVGPGVDVATTVLETGDTTWSVTLTDGTYTFQCDPHAAGGMKGTFTVGAVTTPAVKLGARVAAGAISVSGAIGLTAGSATITVVDRSASDNFHLVGPGVNKSTGIKFRGTVHWTVALAPGTYNFRSDKHKKLNGSFTVSASNTTSSSSSDPGVGTGADGGYGLGGY